MVFNLEHDIMYYVKCPEESFLYDYVVESGRRTLERVKDHVSRDTSSHVSKPCVVPGELKVIGRN